MPVPLLLGLGAIGAGAALKGVNYFRAGRDLRATQKALAEEARTPYAQYGVTPEARQYYSDALNSTINPDGLSGAEKFAYQAGVDRNVNTITQNAARGSGGSMSRFIIGALNPSIINSNNTLLAQDQAVKRANRNAGYGRLAGALNIIQGVNERNTLGEIQRKQMREQYLGQSALQNKAFQTNAIDGLGSDLLSGGLMLGMGGGRISGTGTNPYTGVSMTNPINGYNNPYLNGTA